VTSEISEVSTDTEEAEPVVFASVSTDGGFIKKFAVIVLTSEADEYTALLPVTKNDYPSDVKNCQQFK
jgi:hypothetical protein